ncbi:MAG: hypothetical protein AAF970_14390, partial [Bacteroidota bacterium]
MKAFSTCVLALLLSAGVAQAQDNNASTEQAGDSNEATIEQVGQTQVADVFQGKADARAVTGGLSLASEAFILQT